nr:unnamed protein product [Callosobruchus chinensis]
MPSAGPNPIWEYFLKDGGKATCKICNKSLSLGISLPKRQTTVNIKKHLEKMHKTQWKDFCCREIPKYD